LDGILSIEVNFKVGVEGGQLFLNPDFEFRTPGAIFLVEVAPSGRTGARTEVILTSVGL